jgi:hypothetical protein
MTVSRKLEDVDLLRDATPEECGQYRERTGRLHPRSRWCGLITGEICGATGRACDGQCFETRKTMKETS